MAKGAIKRSEVLHAQGLVDLNVWIPRDLRARIDKAAAAEERDMRVVVIRALEAAFPKAVRGKPAGLDSGAVLGEGFGDS